MVLLFHIGRCYEAEICAILFLLRCPFMWYPFWPKSKFADFLESEKSFEKRIPLERASQGEQNGANFSFVAPSSEELLL